MMDILGALVVIGIFVCWCDVTGAWDNVLRPVRVQSRALSMSSDRQRAETIIKKEERARDGAAAMIEYQAKAIATREKTARLKALRLAKEAQARSIIAL